MVRKWKRVRGLGEGVMEWWSVGVMKTIIFLLSNTPILHYSKSSASPNGEP
jgi:hypothetical protein